MTSLKVTVVLKNVHCPGPGQCAAAVSVMSDTTGPGRGFNSPHAFHKYLSVTLAYGLFNAMNEGLTSYEALMSLVMIDALPFESKDLELKFQEFIQKIAR